MFIVYQSTNVYNIMFIVYQSTNVYNIILIVYQSTNVYNIMFIESIILITLTVKYDCTSHGDVKELD